MEHDDERLTMDDVRVGREVLLAAQHDDELLTMDDARVGREIILAGGDRMRDELNIPIPVPERLGREIERLHDLGIEVPFKTVVHAMIRMVMAASSAEQRPAFYTQANFRHLRRRGYKHRRSAGYA